MANRCRKETIRGHGGISIGANWPETRASEGPAGEHERYSKARLSGFGLIVELAAGGRSAEARKGIALGPGDRNASPDRSRSGLSSR